MKAMFLVTWRQWLRGGARTWFVAFSALVCSTMLAAVQFGGFSLADSFKMESGFSQVVLAASQLVVALLVVLSVWMSEDFLVDVALIYALLSFLTVVVVSRLVLTRRQRHKEDQRREQRCRGTRKKGGGARGT